MVERNNTERLESAEMKPTHKVMKFGGTSMEQLQVVVSNIQKERAKGEIPNLAVTVSAVSGATKNAMSAVERARDLCKELRNIKNRGIKAEEFSCIKRVEEIMDLLFGRIKEVLSEQVIDLNVVNPFQEELIDIMSQVGRRLNSAVMDAQEEDYLPSSFDGFEDSAMRLGEYLSAQLLVHQLNADGKVAELVDCTGVFHSRNGEITEEDLVEMIGKEISDVMHKGLIPVVPGWFGPDTMKVYRRGYTEKLMCILGRGIISSDPYADPELDIRKEFPIFPVDPRRFKGEQEPIERLSSDELGELLGGNFEAIHPGAVRDVLLASKTMRLRFSNTFDPEHPGTTVTPERSRESDVGLVQSIAIKDNVVLLSLEAPGMISTLKGSHGYARRVAQVCEDEGVSIDVIATSENSITFSVDKVKDKMEVFSDEKAQEIVDKIAEIEGVKKVERVPGEYSALVCVGEQMAVLRGIVDYAGAQLTARCGIPVMVRSQSRDRSIPFIVPTENVDEALDVLYEALVKTTKEQFYMKRQLLKQVLEMMTGADESNLLQLASDLQSMAEERQG